MKLAVARWGPGGRVETDSRGASDNGAWTFERALFQGSPPGGGLFVPARLAPMPDDSLREMPRWSFQERAFAVAHHLLGDSLPADMLRGVVRDALDFPVPLRRLEPGVHVLELFHGPTHAFKDVGARFMARIMAAFRPHGERRLAILAATSGDTGAAVAHAFFGLPGVRVIVLYPEGRVSPRQAAQFCTLGGNVLAVGVQGSFDDCQRLVREALADADLRSRHGLVPANSINVGRLLPQTFYYAHAWAEHAARPGRTGAARAGELIVSVPSGNFGNLAAGVAARALGVPIAGFVAATNANAVVPAHLAGGAFRPAPSVPTISNAMDVGNPSNWLRVLHLFGGDVEAVRGVVSGSSWTDEETRACIRDVWRRSGIVLDPHAAVGLLGLRRELARRPGARGIVLATAHPGKFAETVEPLVGRPVAAPPGIAAALDRPARTVRAVPELAALRRVLTAPPPARSRVA